MSNGLEAVFAGQASQVMDRQATYELIQLRLAQEAAAAAQAGATLAQAEIEVSPVSHQ